MFRRRAVTNCNDYSCRGRYIAGAMTTQNLTTAGACKSFGNSIAASRYGEVFDYRVSPPPDARKLSMLYGRNEVAFVGL